MKTKRKCFGNSPFNVIFKHKGPKKKRKKRKKNLFRFSLNPKKMI